METKQDTITKLKNTLRSHKGHLTRHLKQLDRLVEFMATCPNDNTIQGLMDEQAAVQTQFNTLESLYTQLIDSGTPEDVESCAKRLDEMADQRTAALEKVSVALAAAQPSPRPPVNTQSTVGLHKPKVQEALRPFKLKTNHTPVDLRSWLGKFQAYFTSSGLHAYSAQEQHAFLFNCMTPDLEVRIKENDNFTQDMPLYSDDDSVSGVMTLLETEFLQAYPLFNRRLDFFRLKQAQGQTFSDFMLKLKQKGEEADLHKLNTEELYIFRYITGASDITLRERFLKLADPTLDDLKRAVRAYEVGLKAARGMDRENNRGMLVKGKKGQQRNKLPKELLNTCLRCGKRGHKSKECDKNRDDLTCSACKKKGHVSNVCLQQWKAKSRPTSINVSRAASRAASPEPENPPQEVDRQRAIRSYGRVRPLRGQIWQVDSTPRLRLQLNVNGWDSDAEWEFDATPDTGATVTIFATNVLSAHNVKIDRSRKIPIEQVNGASLRVDGKVTIWTRVPGGPIHRIEGYATPDMTDDILVSWRDLMHLNVIPTNFPAAIRYTRTQFDALVGEIKVEFNDVLIESSKFEGAMIGEPMVIHLTDGPIVPKHCTTARSIPVHLRVPAATLIQRLVNQDIITPVTEPTDWISPGHFVPKPDGGVRLVTDYTQLNEYVKRPVHPFPST